MFCELVQMLADSSDLDDEIDELLQAFEAKSGRPILHTVVFYSYARYKSVDCALSALKLDWCNL